MAKLFWFLILFFVSCSGVHADWEEETFDITSQLSSQNQSSPLSNNNATSLALSLSTIQLNEGWGYQFAHSSTLTHNSSHTSETAYSDAWYLSSRVFLNQSLDVEVKGLKSSQIKISDLYLTRNLPQSESNFTEYQNSLSGIVDIAKDEQFWSIFTSVNYIEIDNRYTEGVSFLSAKKLSVNSQFEWQISEDSFLTSRMGFSEASQQFSDEKVKVVGTYLGFKTKYLGSSQLEVFLGDSSSPDTVNIFSWQLNQITDFNEYSKLVLSSKRALQETDGVRSVISKTTEHKLAVTMAYSEVWSVGFGVEHKYEAISESINSNYLVIDTQYNWTLSERWRLGFSYMFEDFSDDIFGFTQKSIQVQVFRDIV